VVTYWAVNQGYDVNALTFKYGQIAEKETKVAVEITRKLGIPLKTVDMSHLKEIFTGVTSLVDKNIEMTPTFSQPIIVPFRNAIFLSVAVAHSIGIGAKKIFYGAHGSDTQFYPDCRKEFYQSFEKTAQLGTETKIQIEAPFSGITKAELIKKGKELSVPFELTWSCYFDREKHCGKCESCVNRKKAFKEANILDPTEYME
jgi:7-cyano-7-deazaguanine synthase